MSNLFDLIKTKNKQHEKLELFLHATAHGEFSEEKNRIVAEYLAEQTSDAFFSELCTKRDHVYVYHKNRYDLNEDWEYTSVLTTNDFVILVYDGHDYTYGNQMKPYQIDVVFYRVFFIDAFATKKDFQVFKARAHANMKALRADKNEPYTLRGVQRPAIPTQPPSRRPNLLVPHYEPEYVTITLNVGDDER